MEELYLIYINYVGENHKGDYIYEFLFSDTNKNIDGDDWDAYPASGRPKPPQSVFIKKIGILSSEMKIDVIQNSDSFCVWDAVDGVISLGWENINAYESYPTKRIAFQFGELMSETEAKLYERDLILQFNKIKYGETI